MQRSASYTSVTVLNDPLPEGYYGGRLFGALLPPLTVLVVGGLLALLALRFVTPQLVAAGERLTPAARLKKISQPVQPAMPAPMTQLAPLFTPQVRYWEPQILAWAQEWSLDPNLIATVMQIESCGDPQARSSSGAMGLFQVMPFHFIGAEDSYDPQVNALRGLGYLRQAYDARAGAAREVLASYNAGISGASVPEAQWPAETQRYAYWGNGIYADALQGSGESPTLQEWLNAGGAHLCQQADVRLGLNTNQD